MANEKPFLLTGAAIAQIQQVVREFNNRHYKNVNNPLPQGRWQGRYPITSGGSQIISFIIVSSDPTTRSALVDIQQRAFTGLVYGSTLEDTVVTVYDTDGCYLNEPDVDLTARRGKAVLMYTDTAAAELHFPGDPAPPNQYWCVMSICCPQIVCEV